MQFTYIAYVLHMSLYSSRKIVVRCRMFGKQSHVLNVSELDLL